MPRLISLCLDGRVRPRLVALAYLSAIVTLALATVVLLSLALLHFFAGSLLAAMGDSCGGIFASGHSFLAASRLNYLLATVALAAVLMQLVILAGGGARLLGATRRLSRESGRQARRCPALPLLCRQAGADRLYQVPGPAAAGARTVGLLRGRVLVSEGLALALDSDELRAVIAHEEAHRAGRDNLIKAVARTLTLALFYLPGPRFAWFRMQASLEEAADRRAAVLAGGPLTVAATLTRVASLMLERGKPSLASAIDGSDVGLRVEALLATNKPRRYWRRLALFVTVSAATLTLFGFSSLAVASSGHNEAVACFINHHLPEDGVCEFEHPAEP